MILPMRNPWGFSQARQHFTRVMVVTSHHSCLVTPAGFYYGIWSIAGDRMLNVAHLGCFRNCISGLYLGSTVRDFDLWRNV